jgi:hypothetical protein
MFSEILHAFFELNTNASPSTSVLGVQKSLASAIGALLILGFLFLCFTSLVAAFFSGCPFRSALSSFIRLIFDILRALSRRISCGCLQVSSKTLQWLQWLRIGTLVFSLFIGIGVAIAFDVSLAWFPLSFILFAIFFALFAQMKVLHKPQKYKISYLAALMFLFFSLFWVSPFAFDHRSSYIFLYVTGICGLGGSCVMLCRISRSMTDTGEIDAIAWLLITTPPQNPLTLFKKAGQMTGIDSIGRHYRPRLLESLMPLALLITSYHAPERLISDSHSPSSEPRLNLVNDDVVPIEEDPNLKNLEIYVASLARLSEFKDYEGSFWCLREDAMQHPKLEQPLIDKLVVLAHPRHQFQVSLRSAAAKVLNNYGLDIKGNPLRSPANVLWRSAATLMLNVSGLNSQEEDSPVELATRVEPAHSSEETEEV